MAYRRIPFINDGIYHIFNRGVNKQEIFFLEGDYQRFFETAYYYQFKGPKPRFSTHKKFKVKDYSKNPKIVDILCFCLMPNHFHLLLKQLKENGIVEFMSKLTNSYTKYFNIKHKRVGYLVQGEFKSVFVEDENQLLHTSRYIHLNPLVAGITKDIADYMHSSYPDYIGIISNSICKKEQIMEFFETPNDYKKFIDNHEDYAKELHRIQHLLIDLEN